MTLLAADIGNSHTVLGLIADSEVSAHWRVSTDARRTAEEWAVLLRGLLGEHWTRISGVAVSATVPAALAEWRIMLDRGLPGLGDLPSVVMGPGVRTGLPMRIDNPREVGTDRIANALGALRLYGGPAVVVDFNGTATTFDVVSSAGHYLGGAIAPGIEVALEALGRAGAQLRTVELTEPSTAIARNTIEAVQSGMLYGVAAQTDGLVARMVAELLASEASDEDAADAEVAVLATGYLADVVVDHCRCFTARAPWLTLQGLEFVFDRNRAS